MPQLFVRRSSWAFALVRPDSGGASVISRSVRGVIELSLAAAAWMLTISGHSNWGFGCLVSAWMLVLFGDATRLKFSWLSTHLWLRWITVVVFALIAAPPGAPDGSRIVVWICAALSCAISSAEPLFSRATRRRRLFISRIPGLKSSDDYRFSAVWVSRSNILALIVGALVAFVDFPTALWISFTAIGGLISAWVALEIIREVLNDRRMQRALRSAMVQFGPEFAIYTPRADDASYQVTMWLPYFERTGKKFLIICRSERQAAALAKLTEIPVISVRNNAELEQLLVPSLSTVFYVNAASGNGQLVRNPAIMHVHIGHGDSDKASSSNPTHAMYDRVFVAGEAAISRYENAGIDIPREQFNIVGRPQVEHVESAASAIADIPSPTVLYAPTWRGDAQSTELYSLPQAATIVEALLATGARVIFRPHPYSSKSEEEREYVLAVRELLAADERPEGTGHIYGLAAESELSIFDCFNNADAMICDVSSVATDFLQSRKPLAMYVPHGEVDTFTEHFPVGSAAYLIDPEASNIDEVLRQLLNTDPAAHRRDRERIRYLGDFPVAHYAETFVRAVAKVVDSREKSAPAAPSPAKSVAADSVATPASAATLSEIELGAPEPVVTKTKRRKSPWARTITCHLVDDVALLSAMLAGITALFGASRELVSAFALAAILWFCAIVPKRTWWSKTRSLGIVSVHRLWLTLSIVGLLGLSQATAITTGLILLSIGLESWIAVILNVRRLRVVNLPNFPYSATASSVNRLVFLANSGALLTAMVLALLEWPITWLLAVLGFLVILELGLIGQAHRLLRRSKESIELLPQVVAAYAPEFAAYFAAAPGSNYQLAAWLPHFDDIDRRFIVICRTARPLEGLAKLTDAPIIHCPTIRSLDGMMAPSLRAAFYVNNGLKNTHFVERRQITHVWLNHGDSEKPACFNPVHAIYDRIFAAGQAGIDRYARHDVHIPERKFTIVGRPQVAGIHLAEKPVAERGLPTVLYAPTWVGPFADTNVYSLPVGRQIVAGLVDRGCTVIFRAHPLNRKFPAGRRHIREINALLAADTATSGRSHLWGAAADRDLSVADCFNRSDAMISDVSAMVSDFLYSAKPFSIVAMGGSAQELVAQAPVAAASYILNGDLTNLDQVLTELLQTDPLQQRRAETREYYLGDIPREAYSQHFPKAARRILDSPVLADVSD